MNRRSTFTLEVQGSGQLLNMFCTEVKRYFPNATVFDRSRSTNEARRREAELGRRGALAPGQQPANDRLREDLASPPPSDVVVKFSPLGTSEEVTVKTRTRKDWLRHNLLGSSMRDAEKFVGDVLATVRKLG